MSYIDKLLQGQEVQWKTLGEVCDVKNGFAFKSSLFQTTGLPIIRIGNIVETSINIDDVKYFDRQDYKKGNPLDYYIEKGDILIAMSGATAGKIGYYNHNEIAYQNQRVGKFIPQKDTLNNRFLFHFLLTQSTFLYNLGGGGAQPNLSASDIKNKLIIPVPPLSVQEKIVEILDKFTELEAELDCRKRQYAYYRTHLLDFSDEMLKSAKGGGNLVQWKSLGEVGTFVRGTGLQKKDLTDRGVPAIHYGQIYTHYGLYTSETKSCVSEDFAKKARKANIGDLVIATTSENDEDVCKAVAWLGKTPVVVSSDACFYRHNMNSKYVAYFFASEHFQKQKTKHITGTKVRRVNATDLAKIHIPVPPMFIQEKIVKILDKFDTLTNSITEGLPKEIELRRKQYEYYREQLLSF